MLMPMMAEAQIKITEKSNTQKLMTIRMGKINLFFDNDYYLALETSNQFDDPMILPLGKDKKTAIETLENLIDIVASIKKGDAIKIESAYEREFRIYRSAKNTISIHSDGYAGFAYTTKAELTRLLDCVTFDIR